LPGLQQLLPAGDHVDRALGGLGRHGKQEMPGSLTKFGISGEFSN